MRRVTDHSRRPETDHRRRAQNRNGAAAVEFAICLPIIVTLVFASIEGANAIFLKQALTMAAYEGAREACAPGGVHADAMAAAQSVLDARGIGGSVVTITPTVSVVTAGGTQVTVTVTAPASANAVGPQFYYQGSTLDAVVSMVRQ